MSQGLITQQHLENIADAIRDKNGTETEYLPSEMAAAIEAIPNSYTAGDEGKVVSNGALIAQTARAETIEQNGTYDTTENNSVTVNVSGGTVTLPTFWAGDISSKDGYFGKVASNTGGIVPRDASLNDTRPNWSQPFIIKIRFYIEATPNRTQAIFGCRNSAKYYEGGPTCEIRTDGNVWGGISTNGSSWDKTFSFPAGTIQFNKFYDAVFEYDGTDFTVTFLDGITSNTKKLEAIGTPYYSSNYFWQLGNIAQRSDLYANATWYDLSQCYLESNGVKIWGTGIS